MEHERALTAAAAAAAATAAAREAAAHEELSRERRRLEQQAASEREAAHAEREAAAVRKVTKAELAAWAHDVLLGSSRGLSIHAHEGAVSTPKDQPPPANATAVGDDAAAFKAKLQLYRQPDKPLPLPVS